MSTFLFRWNKNYFFSVLNNHLIDYPSPVNISYLWSFGFLSAFCLLVQIISGIFLAMHYTPYIEFAFSSTEHIMRDIFNGWFLRYLHSNGASMFFLVVYCHIFRNLFFGSFLNPRQFLWISGILIFFLMMATAFIGYVLPWGQMSFWGATVITNLFSAIPIIGFNFVEWLWGGFSVQNSTLNRFFSLHFFLPFIILGLIVVHISLLHKNGSTNPLGIENADKISFYPYFYFKDLFSVLLFLLFFSFFLFFFPNFLGHSDNYIPANAMLTPNHIVPEWYFLPFYAILRSVPNKLGGVLFMFSSIFVFFLIPFHNNAEIRSSLFRPIYKKAFWLLFFNFIILGWIGQKIVSTPYIEIGQFATFFYFVFFVFLIPFLSFFEKKLMRV